MATTTIPWNDGSGDNIYLTYSQASGDQTVSVSSDANAGRQRTQTVTFTADSLSEVLTIIQAGSIVGGDWHHYITRSRTLLLDGIEKGPDNTAWVSKTGSVSFTNYGATFNDDHVYFDGTDDYLSNTSFSPTASGNGTIEVVIDNEKFGTATVLVFMGKTNGGLGFGVLSNKKVIWSCGATAQPEPTTTTAKASYSIRKSYYYQNGVSMSTSGSDYWASRNNTNYIGKRSSGNYFKGKIYSIRMYSRQLIKSEVCRNLSIDNIRFNLGLSSYTELEYIETDGAVNMIPYLYYSSGTAHAGSPPLSCEMKVLCKSNPDSSQYILACAQTSDARFYMLGLSTTGYAYAGYRTNASSAGSINVNDSLTNQTPFEVKTVISNGFQSLSIKQAGESDFTTTTGSASGTISGTYQMALFALNNAGTFGNYAVAGTRVYYLKIYDDTTFTHCILDAVPCVYFGQYGLWDRVTNTFMGRYDSNGAITGGPQV